MRLRKNGSLSKKQNKEEANPRAAPIQRAKSSTMHFREKAIRKKRNKTEMVTKERRNSVGTTQKPTSTNKIKKMLKVQRTSISKRRTGRKTTRPILEVAKMRRNLERRTSRQIRSRMTKTDIRGETRKEERPISR